jgi:predicted anti-sigma-YlaC factor YlaD
MACQTIYEDMMSLQLDGMLGPDDKRRLNTHLAGCTECAALWSAMRQVNSMLVASVRDPAPVPADFAVKVMSRIAVMPVARPKAAGAAVSAPVSVLSPVSVLPPLRDYEQLPAGLPEYAQDWQERAAAYARGVAAAGVAIAGAVGLLLVLVVSGVVQVGDAFAPAVQLARTFFDATAMWLRSLLAGVGSEAFGAAFLVVGVVLLGGWQIVSNYYRAASEQHVEATVEVAA